MADERLCAKAFDSVQALDINHFESYLPNGVSRMKKADEKKRMTGRAWSSDNLTATKQQVRN